MTLSILYNGNYGTIVLRSCRIFSINSTSRKRRLQFRFRGGQCALALGGAAAWPPLGLVWCFGLPLPQRADESADMAIISRLNILSMHLACPMLADSITCDTSDLPSSLGSDNRLVMLMVCIALLKT